VDFALQESEYTEIESTAASDYGGCFNTRLLRALRSTPYHTISNNGAPSHVPDTMHEDEFLDTVQREASLESHETARAATEATLQTLGERISDTNTSELAGTLPDPLAPPLTEASPGEAEAFSLDEFVDRVSERTGHTAPDAATRQARAVINALSMIADEELQALCEQLPTEFALIFDPDGPFEKDEFLATVQQRAGVTSTEAANDATTVTLQTLGERFTTGEAKDIALYLPDEFEAAFVQSSGDDATAYSLDEFIDQVAQREQIDPDTARRHVQAVGSTVAEVVSDRELDAAKKQLPDPFGVLFEPPDE
jgi:uncharacterized protein (DUF2267 family)